MDPCSDLALIAECLQVNLGLLGLVQLFVQCGIDILTATDRTVRGL